MYQHASDFADDVCRQLQDDGYSIHQGRTDDGPELAGKHWFTWMKPGMSDAEVGPTTDTELAAWSSALAHRIANSEIALDVLDGSSPRSTMGPFHPARLPAAAFEVETMARRFGISEEAAAAQIEQLKRQPKVSTNE